MVGEPLLLAADRLHHAGRARLALVLAGPLVGPPAGGEPGAGVVGGAREAVALGDLLGVELAPALQVAPPRLLPRVVAAAVQPRPPVGGRVEVEEVRGDRPQQRPVVRHHDVAARPPGERLAQEAQPAGVEVVGRLVEQEQVVAAAEHGRQPHPVALADRQRRQRRSRSVHASSPARATSTRRSASHASSRVATSSASAYACSAPGSPRVSAAVAASKAASASRAYAVASATSDPTVAPGPASIDWCATPTLPARSTRPSSGSRSPARTRSSVVLPRPLSPTTASRVCGETVRSTPVSTRRPPRVAPTPTARRWGDEVGRVEEGEEGEVCTRGSARFAVRCQGRRGRRAGRGRRSGAARQRVRSLSVAVGTAPR